MATQTQNIVAWAKSKVGSKAYSGLCQKFVADAYAYGGGMTRRSAATATAAWKSWCVSTSKSNIPVGAAVYFQGSGSAGHVGLYIGNGQVVHSYPTVMISNINSIPGYRGWGWNGGVKPGGATSGSSTLSDTQYKNIYGSSKPSSSGNSGNSGSSGGSSSSSKGGSSGSGTSTTVSGTREEVQVFHAQDKGNINKWGLLRYFEKIDNPSIGQTKANALLELYNRKSRDLKVTGAFGDITVRGGTLIPVMLDLGDVITSNYMLVDKVVHRFTKDLHTMDLTLEGAWSD